MDRPRWHRIAVVYGVAFAGMNVAGLALLRLGDRAGTLGSTALSALAMFTPLVGVLVVNRLDGRPRLDGLGTFRASRWLLVAMALPLVIALLAMVLGPLLPGASWDWAMSAMVERFGGGLTEAELAELQSTIDSLPVHPVVLALPQAVIAGATLNALFAFGEEVGWRGWLQRELAPLGFWRASVVTGVLWGLWHAPLILQGHNYPDHPVMGVPLFTLTCVLLSGPLSWVRERAGTVWAAAVFHGVFNGAAGIAMMVVAGSDLIVGVQGVAGLLALVPVNLAVWWWRRAS